MTQPTALMIGSAAMAKMIAELPRVAEPNSLENPGGPVWIRHSEGLVRLDPWTAYLEAEGPARDHCDAPWAVPRRNGAGDRAGGN